MIRRFFTSLLVTACLSSFLQAVTKNKPFQIYEFSKGLDSYHNSTTLPDGFVQDSNNVLFDEKSPVQKRQGYTVAWSTKNYSYTQLWSYTDQTNTTWQIARSSDQITASNLAGSVVKIATVSISNLVGETNAFGNAYFVDQTQGVYYWNATSTTYVSGSPTGSIITQFHNRLWVTGASVPNGNQLYASGYYAGNTWTTGPNPTDPAQYSIGLQDNFDNVTAEYVYLDTLYLFKHYSIFALYGFDQTSFQISQLTQECGCIDGNSIQTYNQGMEFVSLRGVEKFNGYSCTRISDPVKNKVDPAIQVGGFSQQSWVQQNQADWNSGTLNQLNSLISPPSLVLSTQAAFSQSDNSQSNWQSGTLLNLSATSNPPNLQLSGISPSAQSQQSYSMCGGSPCFKGAASPTPLTAILAQSFTTDSNSQYITGVQINCEGNNNGSTTLYLYSDSGNSPGSSIVSGNFNTNSCGTGGSSSWVTINFTPTLLSANTKYWIYGTSVYSSMLWGWTINNTNPYSGGDAWENGSVISGNDFTFIENLQSPQYIPSGSILSRVFDVGFSTSQYLWSWGTFSTSEIDNGQTILYETQVSSSSNGPWDFPVSVSAGGVIGSSTKEFIQYIATMTTTAGNATPVLSNVTLNTTMLERSSGTFTSQIHSIGSINSWGNFSVQDVLNGGNIAFSICGSTNSNMGYPESCASQTPNSQITISTKSYVQWFATFTVTAATQTPTLNSGTVQWFTGSTQIPMASTVWDNRYWLSLTTNTADTANDAVLVLNQSGAWASLDIHAGAFTQYKNSLYHADSNATGNIYLDNQGWADNGTPINAYVRTKTLGFGDLASDDYLYTMYPAALNTGNCTMTIQYVTDKSSTLYSLGSPLLSEFSSFSSVRLPFPIDSSHQDFAQSIDFIFGTDDNQCDWQFEGFEGLFKSRPIQ